MANGVHTQAVLLQMLVASLNKGHWKVACRRYLKLVAGGWPVPQPLRLACEARLRCCADTEREKMLHDAQAWARFSARRDPPAPRERAKPIRRVQPAAPAPVPVRTQWRPLPPHFSTRV